MDTKWKNRKKAISFMIFFLGVSLAIGGFAGILKNKPGSVRFWQVGKLLEDDYQRSGRFRSYIAGRLENLLIMASGGALGSVSTYGDGTSYTFYNYGGYEWYDGFRYYEDGGYDDDAQWEWENYRYAQEQYIDSLSETLDGIGEMWDVYSNILAGLTAESGENAGKELESLREEIGAFREELESYRMGLRADRAEAEAEASTLPETEAGKEEGIEKANEKIARKYHDLIKGDQNLLYSVSRDGKVLYANAELSAENGMAAAPEGYNFLLYFDGEKVRIWKDGKEEDVYGDGYYREESGAEAWYVPGYRNFPADESLKNVTVCMAVAEDPFLYVKGAYEKGGSRQYDNALYWMNYYMAASRRNLLTDIVCLASGLFLVFLSMLCRKSRREAEAGIARLQGKIWVECKILYFCGLLFGSLCYIRRAFYYLWGEWEYAFPEDYTMEGLSVLGREILEAVPTLLTLLLFWSLFFLWKDLKYNKRIWKNGLIARLYRTFSSGNLNRPLSKRMAARNLSVFLCAAVFGIMMFALAVYGRRGYGNARGIWGIGAAAVLGVFLFILAAYLAGKKNMETARDLEELAKCVGEIRDGNYKDFGGQFAGHDLESIMEQMEDIRCGMEKAVDEQMKSERMKVELIANVSHDIKTPLTSIISYVQFLKQEEGLPEHVKEYVAILDEKSQRLKNMVQDVFAVSKAASGELPMQMEELDFGKLLRQTLADMEEEIGRSPVVFRTEIPEEAVMIRADGQRMYRVFQNLFQNAIQYSLEGSRVYVSLRRDGRMAVASVKNTSSQELEKGKDFAERFARGDGSRTDGGSGLGLSIAQSFTEACGGEFGWETDADLFVVRIGFQTI